MPEKTRLGNRVSGIESLHRLDFHSRVKVFENPVIRPAAEGNSVRADLAEAGPVSPTLAEERVAIDAVRIFGLLVHEEIVGNVERPAHGKAAQDELEIGRASCRER